MPARSVLLALCGALVLVFPRVADAQTETQSGDAQTRAEILRNEREAKRGELEPYEISSTEARLLRIQQLNFPRNIFVRGWNQFRPLIGGMPSGSGFVVGPGFVNGLDRENFDFVANARVSTRGFTTFDTQVNFPTVRSGSPVLAYARAEARNLTELRFFGLGPDTLASNDLTYELQDRTFEAGLRAQLGRFVEVFGRGGILAAEVRGGTGDDQIFDVFPPEVVPGFGGKTNYVVYGGDVTVDLRDEGFPPVGAVFRVRPIGTRTRRPTSSISTMSLARYRDTFRSDTGTGDWRSGCEAPTRSDAMAGKCPSISWRRLVAAGHSEDLMSTAFASPGTC